MKIRLAYHGNLNVQSTPRDYYEMIRGLTPSSASFYTSFYAQKSQLALSKTGSVCSPAHAQTKNSKGFEILPER